ncbi:MAG: carboxypeptidase-like regulatory domain-containing protein [Balneolaceae bacterium]
MLNKGLISSVLLLLFIGIGCSSPSSLTSEEITDVIGVVVDEDSYERIANVELRFADRDEVVTTSENGTFTVKEVNVGMQTVTIEGEGYGTVEKEVEVINEGTRLQIAI